jgi:hypothetical protein
MSKDVMHRLKDLRPGSLRRAVLAARDRERERLMQDLALFSKSEPELAQDIRDQVDSFVLTVGKARSIVQTTQAEAWARAAPELLGKAPAPEAQIPYTMAWERARIDLVRCQELVNGEADLRTLLKVHINCTDWCWFWSVNERTPEARKLYEDAAEKGEQQLGQIRELVAKLMEKKGIENGGR